MYSHFPKAYITDSFLIWSASCLFFEDINKAHISNTSIKNISDCIDSFKKNWQQMTSIMAPNNFFYEKNNQIFGIHIWFIYKIGYNLHSFCLIFLDIKVVFKVKMTKMTKVTSLWRHIGFKLMSDKCLSTIFWILI